MPKIQKTFVKRERIRPDALSNVETYSLGQKFKWNWFLSIFFWNLFFVVFFDNIRYRSDSNGYTDSMRAYLHHLLKNNIRSL